MSTGEPVDQGTLGLRVESVSRNGHRSGALKPIPIRVERIEDSGVPFMVHVHTGLRHKAAARVEQKATGVNPFLPPDPDLFVGNISATHCLVLNKFNVFDRHLLIVTREYVSQDGLLTVNDLAALLWTLEAVDGLGFYNGGTVGGASQPHRHLQLVPVPLGRGPLPTPVDALLDPARLPARPDRIHTIPFTHAVVGLDAEALTPHRADQFHARYLALLEAIGIHSRSQPFNLLVTRRWMMAVPRSREHWDAVSVNALGFAGSLLVRDTVELEALRLRGPMAVLRSVAGRSSA